MQNTTETLAARILILSFAIFASFAVKSQSQFTEDSLWSNSLNEYRKLKVYLPNNYSKESKHPVIYATDGQLLSENYKLLLDSLIQNKIIKPIVMIGAYSNQNAIGTSGLTYRTLEYMGSGIFQHDSTLVNRYKMHMDFFSVELIKYVESKYSVSTSSRDRIFYGCSNGAGFGISLSFNKPESIQHYICNSTVGYQLPDSTSESESNYYLSYGSKEPEGFINSSKNLITSIQKNKVRVSVFEGGHNDDFWIKELRKVLIDICSFH